MTTTETSFTIGDTVLYTNDYGVDLGRRTIVGVARTTYGVAYYLAPTDTPWFAVPERELSKVDVL